MTVKMDEAPGYTINEHGLIKDRNNNQATMFTDIQNRIMVGLPKRGSQFLTWYYLDSLIKKYSHNKF